MTDCVCREWQFQIDWALNSGGDSDSFYSEGWVRKESAAVHASAQIFLLLIIVDSKVILHHLWWAYDIVMAQSQITVKKQQGM